MDSIYKLCTIIFLLIISSGNAVSADYVMMNKNIDFIFPERVNGFISDSFEVKGRLSTVRYIKNVEEKNLQVISDLTVIENVPDKKSRRNEKIINLVVVAMSKKKRQLIDENKYSSINCEITDMFQLDMEDETNAYECSAEFADGEERKQLKILGAIYLFDAYQANISFQVILAEDAQSSWIDYEAVDFIRTVLHE